MTPHLLDRYLRLLSVPHRPPGLEALSELVRAQVERIPFENLSKLYRFHRFGLTGLPSLEEHLDGIEWLRLGGTCYANNAYLHALLLALGYEVRLYGGDMSHPDVHMVNVVMLGGREFLVDGGYGAPFLTPMPLDDERDQVLALGRDRYLLHPRDPAGSFALEHIRDGQASHGYRVRPIEREVAHFRGAIADSFRPGATFMNAVVLVRFSAGRSRSIRNLSFVEAWGDQELRRPIAGADALVELAETGFGVPREVTTSALEVVGKRVAAAPP